jgi:hypothetical protein
VALGIYALAHRASGPPQPALTYPCAPPAGERANP